MQNSMWKKGLVLGIIVLFVGAGVVPSISGTATNLNERSSRQSIVTLDGGGILYVGGTGEGNYTSIQDAINDASDGDTVFVYNGTYCENVIVNKSINLIGENKETTIIDGEGVGYYIINISSSNVMISEFTVLNTGGQSQFASAVLIGFKIHVINVIITDCIFTNNNRGILFKKISNLIIENCHFHDNADNSVRGYGSSYDGDYAENVKILNCTANDNGAYHGGRFQNGGIYIGDRNYDCSNIEIANCTIYNNIEIGIFVRDMENVTIHHNNIFRNKFTGIEAGGNIINLGIYHNNIHDNEYFGIFGGGPFSNATIWGNNVCMNGNGSNRNYNYTMIDEGGIYFHEVPSEGLVIKNNTISKNDMCGILLIGSSGVEISCNNFFNNIVFNAFFKGLPGNRWVKNYWGRPRFFFKPIFGCIWIDLFDIPIPIPSFNFDWHPSSEPYDIPQVAI